MTTRHTDGFFDEVFAQSPVMGIFRGMTPARTVEMCRAAWAAGARAVEVPAQGEAGLEALAAAIAAGRDDGRLVGAGTVRSAARLREVVELGAGFTVAPGFDAEVVELSAELGVPHLPGVATSTEIHVALSAGLTWVKAFPASELGPGWVAAQRAPFPEVKVVATGGIGVHNARAYLEAGCRGVAIGSAFSDREQLDLLVAEGLLPGTGDHPCRSRNAE